MAQHDYIIANQGFPATRSDINNVLSAISTNNSGTSAPSTQYAGQFWIDTTSSTWTMYIHDGADDIQFATINTSANTVNFIDSELGADSVNGDKIADDSIDSEHYVDGSIDTAHISDGAVTYVKSSGFGKIAQIVQGSTTVTHTTTSTAYTDTGLTATITPSATTSKILVLTNQIAFLSGNAQSAGSIRVDRNGTVIAGGDQRFEKLIQATGATATILYDSFDINYLDSPSSTSALTYKTQSARYLSGDSVSSQPNNITSRILLIEVLD